MTCLRLILCAASLSMAGFAAHAQSTAIVDNPGLCDADDGEQELADLTYIEPNGIFQHLGNCQWNDALTYTPGLDVQVQAVCWDGSTQFNLAIDISVNAQGRITAWGADGSTGLPDYYFPCESWGYRN